MKKLGISLVALLLLTGCSQATPEVTLPDSVEIQSGSDNAAVSGTEATGSNQAVAESETPPEAEPIEPEISSDPDIDSQQQSSTQDFVIDYAELEIEDQSGDGRTVAIEELRTSLPAVAKASATSTPVSIELRTPITVSQELYAQLFVDNGNGDYDSSDLVVYEDLEEREPITEDFDYRVR
jgi:hypothetical protein